MKIKIEKAVLVEGKYDKIKLESLIDGLILQTDGFRIFKDKEKCDLIRTLTDTVGLLVLTDSDVAGFKIRNYIKSITHNSPNVTHVYIPQIEGKEKRKSAPSKEGTLGVEGLDADLLRQLLSTQKVDYSESDTPKKKITKLDFYEDGLCGGQNSSQHRAVLLKKLALPSHLSANALLDLLNVMMSYEDYQQLIASLSEV